MSLGFHGGTEQPEDRLFGAEEKNQGEASVEKTMKWTKYVMDCHIYVSFNLAYGHKKTN